MIKFSFDEGEECKNVVAALVQAIAFYSGDEVEITQGKHSIRFLTSAPERKTKQYRPINEFNDEQIVNEYWTRFSNVHPPLKMFSDPEIVDEYHRRFPLPVIARLLKDEILADEFMRRVEESESFRQVMRPRAFAQIKDNLAGIIDEILEEISKG